MTANEPLTWWESVQRAGLFGGRAALLNFDEAVELLARHLRGRRRQDAVSRRMTDLLAEGPGTYSTGASDAASALRLLESLLRLPPSSNRDLAQAVATVALAVAHGDLLAKAGTWAGPDGEELRALHERESTEPVWAYVDLEGPRDRGVRELAIVRVTAERTLEASFEHPIPADAAERCLEGCVVVAHNGRRHDFPILEGLGVGLPEIRLDTLEWAWLAEVRRNSHSQQSLLAEWCDGPQEEAHTALGDARELVRLTQGLRQRLRDLPARTRAGLRAALEGHEADLVLTMMLETHETAWTCNQLIEQSASAQNGAPGPRRVIEGEALLDERAVTVYRSLREAPEDASVRALGRRVIDGATFAETIAGSGWAGALGVALLDGAAGAIDLAPPSIPSDLDLLALPRLDGVVEVGDFARIATDLATLAIAPPPRPIRMVDGRDLFSWPHALVTGIEHPSLDPLTEDGVQRVRVDDLDGTVAKAIASHVAHELMLPMAQAFAGTLSLSQGSCSWSPQPFDPATFPHHLEAYGPWVTLDRPEVRAMWTHALGEEPDIVGSCAPRTVQVTVVVDPPGGGRSRTVAASRALALLLSGLHARVGPVVLATSPARRTAIGTALKRLWHELHDGPLLRPPEWPTVPETAHRLRSRPHAVVTTYRHAASLPASALTIVDRVPRPDSEHPIVARLFEAANDPFADVVEPYVALRLSELLARSGPIVLLEPLAGSPAIHSLQTLTGPWRSARLDDLPESPHRDVVIEAFGTSGGAPPSLYSQEALHAALRHLLPLGASLRDFQRVVIDDLRDRHDVLAVFRTGSGKSLCYQAPALAAALDHEAVSIVVSPLLALQRNQLESLQTRGVWNATLINSSLSAEVRQARIRGIRAGFYTTLFVAPEALLGSSLTRLLREVPVELVAIDEAHVVSEMGHDFRPDYRMLPVVLRRILQLPALASLNVPDRPTVVALTGTATPAVRDDIQTLLEVPFRTHVDGSFIRDELEFGVWDVDDHPNEPPWSGWVLPEFVPPAPARPADDEERWRALVSALTNVDRPAIVYADTRRTVEHLAGALRLAFPAETIGAYHAGIGEDSRDARAQVERAFLDDQLDVIVTTNAFGMGVDKADVRAVLHWRMPPTPEALYQEAGRAARDLGEETATCLVLYRASDLSFAAWLRSLGTPTYPELQRTWATLEEISHRQTRDDDATSDIAVTDEDLALLAGLRDTVEPRVLLGYLERTGLVREIDRLSAQLELRRVAHGGRTDRTEDALLSRLPDTGWSVVDVGAVVTKLAENGPDVTPRDVLAAARRLERDGTVEVGRSIGIQVLVSDLPTAAHSRWEDVRAVGGALLRSDRFKQGRYLRLRPEDAGVDLPRLLDAIELLSAEGCVRVRREVVESAVPMVAKGAARMESLRAIHAAIGKLAANLPRDEPRPQLKALAEKTDLPPPLVLRALTALHLLGAVSLDRQSWLDEGSTVRLLRLTPLTPARIEQQLREAERVALQRQLDDAMKRQALKRYAAIPWSDDTEQDPYQVFLQRYFTEPTFLDDLAASTTGRLLDGLNDRQRQAVTSEARTTRVVAGPGSGKTHTMARRIAYRVSRGAVLESGVVAISFTKDAATQLRVRLAALGVTGAQCRTIHSLARRLVMDHHGWLGYEHPPDILTQDARRTRLLPRLSSQQRRDVLTVIDRAVNALIRPETLLERWEELRTTLKPESWFVDAYRQYDAALAENGCTDFPHLVASAIRILASEQRGDDARAWVREVYVDEIQDVNLAEFEFVRLLSENAGLTVVGDPRQAIYTWKGARPDLMTVVLDAARTEVRQVELTDNYRSGEAIIEAVNRVGAVVAGDLDPLVSISETPSQVEFFPARDTSSMLKALTERVEKHLAERTPDDEIAVIARGEKSVTEVVQALRGAGVASRPIGLPPLATSQAFEVFRGYGPLLAGLEIPISLWLEHRTEHPNHVTRLAGVDEDATERNHSDWMRLVAAAKDAEDSGAVAFDEIEKHIRSEPHGQGRGAGVAVSTIHKAKGLEWDVVLVADVDRKKWYANGAEPSAELQRLFYVAVSRPRSHLELHWDDSVGAYPAAKIVETD